MASGGTTQISSSLTSTNAIETINAPIVLSGAYTFANNSASGTGAGAGTLNFGGTITGPATAGTTVLTLSGSNTNANTIRGVIANGNTGAGDLLGITESGGGNWNLTGVNTYTGATTVGAGTLTISGAGDLGSGTYAGAISDSGTFNYNSSANQTLSGVISGSGGVVENGTGTLTLTGANTYTGGLTIDAGTVVFGSNGVYSIDNSATGGTITLGNAANTGQNATLEFNPSNSFSAVALLNPITVTGNGTDTIETINHSPYFGGAVTLSNNLTILLNDASTAQMVFTSASSFTGTGNIITQVDSSATTIPTGSYIGLNGSINNTGMIINNGTGQDALLIGSGGATTIGSNVTGIVEDSATSPIEFMGTAATINSTAAMTIDAGTISFTATNGVPNSSSKLVFNGTGVFISNQAMTLGGLTLNGGVGDVNTSSASGKQIALGAITQGSTLGMVDVVDSGTTTSGIATSTGNTNGIIAPWAFTGTGTSVAYAVGNGATTNITSYGSATTATASNVTSATTNYTLSTGTLTLANTSTAYTLQFTGTANALALSTFGLTLDGLMNTGSGTLTVSNGTGGTLTIGTTNITNASQLDIIAGTNGITISAPIAGSGSLVYGVANGSTATLVLSGANSYTGSTVVNSGTLQVQNAAALGQNTNSLNVESGAILDLDGTSGVFVGALNSAGLAGGTIEDGTTGTPAAVTLTVGTGGGTGNFAGVIANGTGTVSLTKNGGGSQTLTGVNTYTGATTIGAGTLIIGGAGQLGSGTYAGAITDSGTFNYNSSAVQTLSGAISGAGGLVQNGTGTLTLTGSNTYTGGTTVNSGLLTAITAATGGNESANLPAEPIPRFRRNAQL